MNKYFFFKNKHFLALAGNLIISGFSVLTISILYRVLNKTDVGSWFFFLGIYSFTDALRNGLLSTAIIKFYAGSDSKTAKKVLGSGWVIVFFLTGIILLLNLFAWLISDHFNNSQANIVVKWIGLTFISSIPFNFAFWVLVAEEKYMSILLMRLINSLLMILLIVYFSFLKIITLENLIFINFITNVITSFVCLVMGYTHITTLLNSCKEKVKEIYNFGKYNLAANLGSNLISNHITFLITFFLGPSSVAIYNLPQRLMEIVEIPLRSFVGTGMTAMAINMNKNKIDGVRSIYEKFAGILTFAFIPIALLGIIFSDLAIQLLGGKEYLGTEASNIFRISILFSIFYPIDRFNGVSLDILHHPKENLKKVILVLSISFVGGIFGLYFMNNLYGLLISFPISLFAGIAYGYYKLNKYMPYKNRDILYVGWKESKMIIQSTLNKFKNS